MPQLKKVALAMGNRLAYADTYEQALLQLIESLRGARLEKYGLIAAFAVYLLFQTNAAFHHGSWGQDFYNHRTAVIMAADHPWWFLTRINPVIPEPPLYYLLCGALLNLTGATHYLEVIAVFSAILSALAFLVLYQLTRLSIENPFLRLSCLVFLLFAPFLMIHAVVLSTDAFTLPLFIAIFYLFRRLAYTSVEDTRTQWLYIAGIWMLLVAGVMTKLTFVSQILAAIIGFWILYRVGSLKQRIAIRAIALGALLLALGTALTEQYLGELDFNDQSLATRVRDIIFPHKADVHIFRAPSYDEPVRAPRNISVPAPPFELQQQDKYSYPALLHLGVFTDVMNIYQYDPSDSPFGRRSTRNAARMRLAVKSGLAFSLVFLILTPIGIFRALYACAIKKQAAEAPWAVLAVGGVGWFANIVVFFPHIPAYGAGLWLPRLILPALVSFVVLSTSTADRFLRRRSPVWALLICVLVVCQSLIHLSFLWPWK